MDSIYWQVKHVVTRPILALLLVVFVLCLLGFEWRKKTLGSENPPLDGRWQTFGYTPQEANTLFKALDQRDQLTLYGVTEVTLDLIFPFVYGILLAALLITLYDPASARWLILLPLLVVVADLIENTLIAVEAFRFNGETSPFISIAALCTATKYIFLLSTLVAITIGAAGALRGSHDIE